MARKATDLLDVFRFNSDDGNDDHERKTRRKDARDTMRAAKGARRTSKKKAATFDGIHLTPRHLLLASSAGVLLLVLSFTLGLAAGRPGESSGPAPGLQRQTLVMIRATLPLVDPTNRKPTDPGAIRRKLRHEYGLEDRYLKIRREDGRLVLEVGPFRSQEAAAGYLRSSGLELAHLCMDDPFRWPAFVPYESR